MRFKVNTSVKCSFGKFSFVRCGGLVDLMIMKTLLCS